MSIYMLLSLIWCCVAKDAAPSILPPVTLDGEAGSCPSSEVRSQALINMEQTILEILQNPSMGDVQLNCGHAEWHRIAYLNMSDPNQVCPADLMLITTPVRGCGQSTTRRIACDSVVFPSPDNQPYSRVCGRVHAYLQGYTYAFWNYIGEGYTSLESAYLDGVSLTHGPAGSRQHIWSFAASYAGGTFTHVPGYDCSCTDATADLDCSNAVPPFVGNNYFCETAYIKRPAEQNAGTFYENEHLWDGEGCDSTTSCCQFNDPPWFSTTLPQSTTDDIELRNCNFEGPSNGFTAGGDTFIDLVEIYVM